MAKYITYELENIEDLKLSQSINQIDNECSKDFIDGSAIRGAFISKYIKDKNVSNINDGEHREKVLRGGLKFLNAYPCRNSVRSIPFPKCFYADKDELKRYSKSGSVKLSSQYENNYKRVDLPKFVLFDDEDEVFKNINVKKKYSLHINKRETKNNLFRYETIKSGQTFKGIIAAEDEYADECKEILNDSSIYIGGSKDSGYGKCSITNVRIEEENVETEYFNQYKRNYNGTLYIYLLSDLIYINKLGQYQNFIDGDYIKEKLRLKKADFDRGIIQTEIITGYNSKWGCSVPSVSAVAAGSILVYTYDGELDEKLVKKFEEESVGERIEDGFGRCMILNSMPDAELEEYEEEITSNEPEDLDGSQKKQLKIILNDIYRYKVENKKNEIILNLEGRFKNVGAMKTNQWGKLYQLCDNVEKMSIEEGRKRFIDYIEHYEKKENNKSVTFQFKNVKYENMDLFDFIRNYINDSDNVEKFKSKHEFLFKDIVISNVKPEVDKNYVYKYNISVLKELFRIFMKKSKYAEGGDRQ